MTALLTSELRKVTTLRFWWALALAPLVVALFAGTFYAAMAGDIEFSSSKLSTGAASVGLFVAIACVALFAGLFGAINSGTEFRHQTLTPTLLTTAGRDRVVAGKLAVTAAFGAAYAVVVEAVAVICILTFADGLFEMSWPVAAMLAAGVLTTVAWSLIGAGLGLALGSSTTAAVALVSWYPAGELVVTAVLHSVGAGALTEVLPAAATWSTIAATSASNIDEYAPWPVAVLALLFWTCLACGLGWWAATRRDVT